MKYFEHDNLIYRADVPPGWTIPVVNAYIRGGQWCPVTPRQRTEARTWGTPMTEEEAKEFQGDGWPASDEIVTAKAD